jgi:hypothetical protein
MCSNLSGNEQSKRRKNKTSKASERFWKNDKTRTNSYRALQKNYQATTKPKNGGRWKK